MHLCHAQVSGSCDSDFRLPHLANMKMVQMFWDNSNKNRQHCRHLFA